MRFPRQDHCQWSRGPEIDQLDSDRSSTVVAAHAETHLRFVAEVDGYVVWVS